MKKINTALFCIFVLLFCSCDVLNKAPLDEIADDSFWSDETLVKYYVNDLYSEISVDGLQLQENRSDNSVSAQRDKYPDAPKPIPKYSLFSQYFVLCIASF